MVFVLPVQPDMMSPMQNTLSAWLHSLKHYLLMCILLSSPERLTYHVNALVLTLASYYLIGMLLVDEGRGYLEISGQITLELLFLALITYLVLRWKKMPARFLQTFSALTGVNMLISFASLPLYRLSTGTQEDPDRLLITITLGILIWNLAVISLIFKRAFEISTHLSAMLSFNYFVLLQFILYRIYQ